MSETNAKKERNLKIYEGESPLRDYNGSKDGRPVFETTDIDEWNEYCKKKGLKVNGTMPCALCGEVVAFEGLPHGEKPLCEKCLSNVEKYSKHVTIKKLPKSDNT